MPPRLASAAIVAIGSELLTPFRTDTNSLKITARLDDIGIRVVRKSVVGDNQAEIASAIREGAARADLVVLFGHPRLLAEIPGPAPVLPGWHRQRPMQEAAARRLAGLAG